MHLGTRHHNHVIPEDCVILGLSRQIVLSFRTVYNEISQRNL